MDATNKKTLAGGLVLLMLGSLFAGLAIVPVASAQSTNPTGAADVIVNATQRRTERFDVNPDSDPIPSEAETETEVSLVVSPSGSIIRPYVAYDFTLEGFETGGSGYGYLGAASEVYLVNRSSATAISGGVATVYATTGTFRSATFPGITFPGPGLYEARTGSATGTLVARIFVQPANDLAVTISPNNFAWSSAGATFTITVSNANGGVEGVRLTGPGIAPGTTTLAGGTRTIVGPLPGAGTFEIQAELYRCPSNDPAQCVTTGSSGHAQTFGGVLLPHFRSNATLTVTGATLNMTAVATTSFVGFTNTISFRPSFRDTNENVFQKRSSGGTVNLRTDIQDATDYLNVSVVTPGNVMVFANITNPQGIAADATVDLVAGSGLGTATLQGGSVRCLNLNDALATVGACTAVGTLGNLVPATFRINMATGDISFAPGEDTTTLTNVWASGNYVFTVSANSAGAATTTPEYTGTYTVTPATPAAVNLDFSITAPSPVTLADGTTARAPAAGSLDVLAPTTPTGATPVLRSYTLALTVSGSASAEHPMCRYLRTVVETGGGIGTCNPGDDAFTVANVTLRGDLLPGWTVSSYTATTGVATVTGVMPTRNGTIWMDVTWKNTTTSLRIPVIRGANVTADVNNMTVETSQPVTVTVRAANNNDGTQGGAEPSAYVRYFQRDTNGGAFVGTGVAEITGTNQAGVGANGQYTFTLRPTAVQDGIFYAQVGTGASQNYSYYRVDVLPNQALNVTLNVTSTMASLKTQFVVNASNATRAFTSGVNFNAYWLTPADVRDLVNNGTTSLFDGTPVINNCAVMTTSASCKIVPDASTAFGTVFNATLQPNNWTLYFCAGFTTGDCRDATIDNRLAMPVVNVSAYRAVLAPVEIASSADIQQNTVVNIRVFDANNTPANGTVTLSAGSVATTGGTSATISNGQGNITLTGTTVGNVWFDFDPTDPGNQQVAQSSRLDGNLSVIAGNLSIQPSRVPILQSTLVTLSLRNFTGAGLPGRIVRLCSSSLNSNWNAGSSTIPTTLTTGPLTDNCPAVATTAADGSAGIVVTPTSLNDIHVYINNSYTQRTLGVTAGTLVVTVNPTNPQAGGSVTLTAAQPGGATGAGIRILVLRNGTSVLDQNTDANGQAVLSNLTAGTYSVTAIRSGFDNGTATFTVGAAASNATASFELRNLVLPDRINVGSPVTVRVTVVNNGTTSGTANAQLLVNSAQRATQSVTLNAGANQTVEYEFTPTVSGTYAVSVRIGDTTIGPQNIVVGVANTTTPATPPTGGVTPTSTPPTSSVTATPPTSTVTATPPTGTPATTTPETEPTVPGFEVIALLAALGVALLVLRRRN